MIQVKYNPIELYQSRGRSLGSCHSIGSKLLESFAIVFLPIAREQYHEHLLNSKLKQEDVSV